ncbi:MAG: hypothetical protein Q7O66_03155, partial [Dehalococcoidia bacterium]|nr:hypothetical protein [Dehalococcoidia bacterium]
MNVSKSPWPALVLLIIATTFAIGCAESGTPRTGEATSSATSISRITETPLPSQKPITYSTRELVIKELGLPTALWEGKIIYDASTKSGEKDVRRIFQHDLATGLETILVEATPPHTDAEALHRSGDWLFFYETHDAGVRGVPSVLPRDFYALNLRTGQRQLLEVLHSADWMALTG